MKEHVNHFFVFREFATLMKRYPLLSLILALMFVQVWSVSAQESITPGTPIQGEYTGEPVSYTVDASRGQLIVVSMESEAFDAYVAFVENGEEIASDDDSGSDNNALLAFVAQKDGPFTLNAGASYFSDETGAYTLTVDVLDPTIAPLDEPVTLKADESGSASLYAVFKGTTGMVVNLWASTTGDEDVALSLVGVDAAEIDTDDDDGTGSNALLRRLVLPADGLYLIRVRQSYSDELLSQDVELLVETSEQIYLSDTPQELVLGDGEGEAGTEVYTVDVEAGTTYRFIFTVEPLPDDEGGINLKLLDTDRFFSPELDVQHATRVAWDFVPNASGTIRLDVHPNLFISDLQRINYTAALEVVTTA